MPPARESHAMPDPTALPEEDEDQYYNDEIMALGDTQRIIASHDIATAAGIKLLSAGMPVNSQLRERILQHKLVRNLDHSLSFENLVDPVAIADTAAPTCRRH
jgi:hypothetical protein